MIRSCRTSRFSPRLLRTIRRSDLWRRSTAGIARLSPSILAGRDSGRRLGWSLFSTVYACRAAVASSERLFERRREAGRQQLRRAVGGDHHVVFAADAEFARNVDAGLV